MIRGNLAFSLAAAALPPAATPAPPLTILSVSDPLPLAGRLLGRPAPEIVEAQAVPIPMGPWVGAVAVFAPHAHTAGRNGLCRLDLQGVDLRVIDPRATDSAVVPSPPRRYFRYALTGPTPDFSADNGNRSANDDACRGLTPFLNRRNWHLVDVKFNDREADPRQAIFAFRAIIEARRVAHPGSGGCAVPDELVCHDPAAFLRALDPRNFSSLLVSPCTEVQANLCVTGMLESENSSTLIEVRVETEFSGLPREGTPILVRSVTLTAAPRPVI